MVEISNKIYKTEPVAWRDLKFIQTKEFKKFPSESKERLRNSLIQNNFVQTFYVWHDTDKDKVYCLDGFHRIQILKELIMDGYHVPEYLTANFVSCKDRQEAAKYVLIYSSMYAKLYKDGFDDFMQLNNLSLQDVQFEVDLPEFQLETLTDEETKVEEVVEEELAESTRTPIVKAGDLFRIGEHYVLCGDSTSLEDIKILFGDTKANGIITSPPYAEQRSQYKGVPVDEYLQWFNNVQNNCKYVLARDASFFLNIKPHCEDGERNLYVHDLVCAMKREWGWRFTEEYCWTHQGYPGQLDGRFKNQFEPIFHFSLAKASDLRFRPEHVLGELSDDHFKKIEQRKNKKTKDASKKYATASGMGNMSHYSDLKGARPGNVLNANVGAASDHPASFPIKLPLFFVQAFSDQNDTWFDPFGGSGTTLVACEATNRRCRTIDLEPLFIEMIIRRWAKYRSQVKKSTDDFEHINGTLSLQEIIDNI
ncbi:MAG: site-specific DNA-methyltransferase [Candidatus Kapabacteria bacterium]|nr:site-specific DNA-methyltransferase [Candidatus Kapabacteria bacterium]